MGEHEGAVRPAGRPVFQVVRGQPTAAELAALTVVLTVVALRAAGQAPPPAAAPGRRAGGWAQRSRLVRAPLFPGPGAWRRSGGP